MEEQSRRSQIDSSVLASLIGLSQSMGQLQGEMTALKAAGIDLSSVKGDLIPVKRDVEALKKIVVTGDYDQTSLQEKIRNIETILENIQERLRNYEKRVDREERIEEDNIEVKKIDVENKWKIWFYIVTTIGTALLAYLGLK